MHELRYKPWMFYFITNSLDFFDCSESLASTEKTEQHSVNTCPKMAGCDVEFQDLLQKSTVFLIWNHIPKYKHTNWGINCGIEKHLAKKDRNKQQISNKKLGATNNQILKNHPKSKEISTNQAPKQVRRPIFPGFPNFLALLKPSSSTHLVGHPSRWTLLASAIDGSMGLIIVSGIYGTFMALLWHFSPPWFVNHWICDGKKVYIIMESLGTNIWQIRMI